MRILSHSFLTLAIVMACFSSAQAEDGALWVQVSDPLGQPILGVVLSATGPSSTGPPTGTAEQAADVAGKIRIKLASSTRPGDEVELIIVKAPQDLVFISPWNQRVTVPCFDNNTRCVAKVVLAERGSRMLLEYPPAQSAMAARVNATNTTWLGRNQSVEEQRRKSLAEVAGAYGYTPEEVDRAIRSLRNQTSDPYQLGQVALYERDYPEAEKQLSKSKAGQKEKLADVSFLLGNTYKEQGKYSEAIREYREAAALRPSDSTILRELSTVLWYDGQYQQAESLLRQALNIKEATLGPKHEEVAEMLEDLAWLNHDQGNYREAIPLIQQALTIFEANPEPEYDGLVAGLNMLADLYVHQERYAEAEPIFKQSLMIAEKQALEPCLVAFILNNFGLFYARQHKYAEAEPLLDRSVKIWEEEPVQEYPRLATTLNNLGRLYIYQGRYADAEPLLKRSLKTREQHLGPSHPDTASSLGSLALLYEKQRNYVEAESLYKRALAIYEKQFGPGHINVAKAQLDLAGLYYIQGQYTKAEPLYRQGLTVLEKELGANHSSVADTLVDYAALLRKVNRTKEAEKMEARIKMIRAKQK